MHPWLRPALAVLLAAAVLVTAQYHYYGWQYAAGWWAGRADGSTVNHIAQRYWRRALQPPVAAVPGLRDWSGAHRAALRDAARHAGHCLGLRQKYDRELEIRASARKMSMLGTGLDYRERLELTRHLLERAVLLGGTEGQALRQEAQTVLAQVLQATPNLPAARALQADLALPDAVLARRWAGL